MTTTKFCADCGEMFPAQRDEATCRICAFGPLAPFVAGMRDAIDAAALELACETCRASGQPICEVCREELGYGDA